MDEKLLSAHRRLDSAALFARAQDLKAKMWHTKIGDPQRREFEKQTNAYHHAGTLMKQSEALAAKAEKAIAAVPGRFTPSAASAPVTARHHRPASMRTGAAAPGAPASAGSGYLLPALGLFGLLGLGWVATHRSST